MIEGYERKMRRWRLRIMNSLCVKFQCGCRDDDGHRHPRYPRRLGNFLFSPVAQDVIRSRALTLTLVTKFDVVGYRVIFEILALVSSSVLLSLAYHIKLYWTMNSLGYCSTGHFLVRVSPDGPLNLKRVKTTYYKVNSS